MSVSQAKRLARRILTSAAVYPALRRRANIAGSCAILTYHTLGDDDEDFDAWTVVRQGDFERQIATLRQTHDIVSIDEGLRFGKAESLESQSDQRPKAVLTFDDGHEGWHERLLPIVDRLKLPVALYVATGHIESGQPYWFDRIMNAVQVDGAFSVDLSAFGLGVHAFPSAVGPAHWQVTSMLLERLKQGPALHRDAVADAVASQTQTLRKRRFKPLKPLTVQQLVELAEHPCVTLASHSHDHSLLDQVSVTEAQRSVDRSIQTLKRWTGRSVTHFAYPNGNVNDALVDELSGLGLRSATTTQVALHRAGQHPLRVPRLAVGRYDDMDRFKLSLVPSASPPSKHPS
jgi:peptidoglycan/xylan/chitin deacetylase (PgdA/CDA1 family)